MWQILIIIVATSGNPVPVSVSTQFSINRYATQEACNKFAYPMHKKINVNDKIVSIAAECIKIGD